MEPNEAKRVAADAVQNARDRLSALSHQLHANPELNYRESQAVGWLVDWLGEAGYEIDIPVAGLDTAFIARFGSGELKVAVIAEYDALPVVGHACGHNVIAATAVGAALALAPVADQLGIQVSVVGTPAEEGGGGKIVMVERGVFNDFHAALMVHPGPSDVLTPEVLAAQTIEIEYTGRASHAGGFPERGINAADALVVAQTAIGLLRQSLLPSDRVHGIVTNGGEASNIIPEHTAAEWMVRASTVARLDELREKVVRCFEAGALATGAMLETGLKPPYADMIHDPDLVALYRANAEALGRSFSGPGAFNRFSTDMGNVSYVVPSIHPIIGINSGEAVNHQPEFAALTVGPDADQAILDGAVALAWTAIDAATNDEVRQRLLGA